MTKKLKLIMSAMAAALALAGCQTAQSPVAKTGLSGYWLCTTDFPDGTQAKEQYHFDANNHEYQAIGTVVFKLSNGNLPFIQMTAGEWSLANSKLTMQTYGSQGAPADSKLREALTNDKKLQKKLLPMMRLINTGPEDAITFDVTSLTSADMSYQFQSIPTNCTTITDDKVIPDLENNPGKITAYFKDKANEN